MSRRHHRCQRSKVTSRLFYSLEATPDLPQVNTTRNLLIAKRSRSATQNPSGRIWQYRIVHIWRP